VKYEELMKKWHTQDNWRAHIAKYVKQKKRLNGNYASEQYCKKERIDENAFKLWLEFIKREDKYFFYMSHAPEYLRRAVNSLISLKKYIDMPGLRMPLIRDAIVAYVAPFTKSHSRISAKFSLREIEGIVPDSLKDVHKKICDERDEIVAHCDISPRNPRVGLYGIITIRGAGHYWEDYKALIPNFERLVSIVQEELQNYNQKKFISVQAYFKDFLNPPPCTSIDPGQPSEE
jgi:hypothetical protein